MEIKLSNISSKIASKNKKTIDKNLLCYTLPPAQTEKAVSARSIPHSPTASARPARGSARWAESATTCLHSPLSRPMAQLASLEPVRPPAAVGWDRTATRRFRRGKTGGRCILPKTLAHFSPSLSSPDSRAGSGGGPRQRVATGRPPRHGRAQGPDALLSLSVHPLSFCRVIRSGSGRCGSPVETAASVQTPSPARAPARVRTRRRRAALHRCPSPHGAAARVFFPHAEAMAHRRADALAFLSAQPWTAVEQQQVRALCSFFVRVSDCFQLSTSIRDRVASCSVSVSVDSQKNPFQIDLLDRSALMPMKDPIYTSRSRSSGRSLYRARNVAIFAAV